ncbi:hypothetical protein N9Q18_00865 [bacterium]|nr:hypothetical protein [bacterium]
MRFPVCCGYVRERLPAIGDLHFHGYPDPPFDWEHAARRPSGGRQESGASGQSGKDVPLDRDQLVGGLEAELGEHSSESATGMRRLDPTTTPRQCLDQHVPELLAQQRQ